MNIRALMHCIGDNTEYTFSRASGPGGQNVNKVNTKVTARVKIASLSILDELEMNRLRHKLRNRITGEDELVVQAQEERSQSRNREIALERLGNLIIGSLTARRKRIPTRPSAASRERRIQNKKKRSQLKQQRRDWEG